MSRLLLSVLVVAAGGLRWWGLGRQGLWYDEAVTAGLLHGPLARLLAKLPASESTPPLYYVVAWGWVRVTGESALGLRSLSALAGTLTVPAAYAAGRELASRRAGLAAAALVAVSPLSIWYAQEARSYALLELLAALSVLTFARATSRPTSRRLALWSLVCCAALCTHYFAAFVVAGEAALLIAVRQPGRLMRSLACVPPVVVAGLLAGLASRQSVRRYWFLQRPLPFRLEQVARQFLLGFTPPASTVAVLIAALAAVVAGSLLLSATTPGRPGALTAASVAAAALGLPLLAAVAGVDYLNTRNLIAALVPLALVAGIAVTGHRAGAAPLLVLIALSVAAVVRLQDDPSARRPPWNRIAAVLRADGAPLVVRIEGSRTWARPLNWYVPRLWWVSPGGLRTRRIDVVRRVPGAVVCPGATWWGADCDVAPRPALRLPAGSAFRLAGRRRIADFEIARYRSTVPRRVRAGRRVLGRRRVIVRSPP